MAYLDEISVAISPYVARSHKAIEFYDKHKPGNFAKTGMGLFLAIGNGPIDGWENDNPDLPSLETFDIENIQIFKHYSQMFFVNSDVDGKINVGNLKWSKIPNPNDDEKYYENVMNIGARWIYVEFEIPKSVNIAGKIRQVGIYSNLKVNTGNTKSANEIFFPLDFKIKEYGKRKYDGVLELVQNKLAYSKDNTKEIYSFVLEF